MSTVLKRFEIWVLLALVVAALWWALSLDPTDPATGLVDSTTPVGAADSTTDGQATAEDTATALLQVQSIAVDALDSGSVLEVTLLGRSGTDSAVELTADTIELLNSAGDQINRFFLPFDQPPSLDATEPSLVVLRYWLPEPSDVLWLTYRDQTLKVEPPSA